MVRINPKYIWFILSCAFKSLICLSASLQNCTSHVIKAPFMHHHSSLYEEVTQ